MCKENWIKLIEIRVSLFAKGSRTFSIGVSNKCQTSFLNLAHFFLSELEFETTLAIIQFEIIIEQYVLFF